MRERDGKYNRNHLIYSTINKIHESFEFYLQHSQLCSKFKWDLQMEIFPVIAMRVHRGSKVNWYSLNYGVLKKNVMYINYTPLYQS